jgi:murein DD-endopeptidase MepM/ murein hydrolase activator NlpD
MKINSQKFKTLIKKRSEFLILILISIIVIVLTQTFNLIKEKEKKNFINLLSNIYFEKTIKNIIENLDPKYIHVEHKIALGETFNNILTKYEIPIKEINKVKKILSKKNNLNKLKNNQIIKFTLDIAESKTIIELIYPISITKKVKIIRNLNTDKFSYKEVITNLSKKIIYKEGRILQSLYQSATNLKIQPNIIIEFARIYGFEIDFQRDIRKNDTFQILYEVFEDEKEKIFETGKIVYCNITIKGKKNELYYFLNKNSEGHYDKSGRSAKKALMKTPINGARLSSPYGKRKHPILGYKKMHRGTDFAAPMGTPVMASGNGTVIRARWCGGGGNCIKIKHNSVYSTVYAHLSKFASKIKEGRKVKQGQVIGYVGSTGMSTGPHLHYEVIKNGKKINSQKLKLPSGKNLTGIERKEFEIKKIKIDVLKSEIISNQN